MTLSDRLNKLRKELCHGPCGQSNSVLQQREDRDRLLKEAIRAAKAWEIAEKNERNVRPFGYVEMQPRWMVFDKDDNTVPCDISYSQVDTILSADDYQRKAKKCE